MNWESIEANWNQFAGQAKANWSELTEDELAASGGKRDQLAGRLQERYGYARKRAEEDLDDFVRTLLRRELPGAGNHPPSGLCLADGYRAMCTMNAAKGKKR